MRVNYVKHLTQPDGAGGKLSFADDVFLYGTGYNRLEIVTDIQGILEKMSDWC